MASYLFLHGYSLWITRIVYFSLTNQFLSIEQVSPQTFIFMIPSCHCMNSTKTCAFSAVFTTFDTVNLDVNIRYVLRNIFPRYFSLREFHKFTKFSFAKCVYAVNLPKFPAIKVSCHLSFPPYSKFNLIKVSFATAASVSASIAETSYCTIQQIPHLLSSFLTPIE